MYYVSLHVYIFCTSKFLWKNKIFWNDLYSNVYLWTVRFHLDTTETARAVQMIEDEVSKRQVARTSVWLINFGFAIRIPEISAEEGQAMAAQEPQLPGKIDTCGLLHFVIVTQRLEVYVMIFK